MPEPKEEGLIASLIPLNSADLLIAVIVPCYRVTQHIIPLLERIPSYVNRIYCVDDKCPDGSGQLIADKSLDPRIKVISHENNGGVGAAVCTGYIAALADGADICVKLDGDGQMDPRQIATLIAPIRAGHADYAKGNRFFNIEDVRPMPMRRLLGNVALTFFTKLSSGYWDMFDPTNGYTAAHARVLERIPLKKLHSRYFFESDILFRLSCLSARVTDIPLPAIYGDEVSNLTIGKIIWPFAIGNVKNFGKRIIYSYYIRDFSMGSIYLILSSILLMIGIANGIYFWTEGLAMGRAATAGQVMFSALPLVFGLQLGLSFISYDIARTPRFAIHPYLSRVTDDHLA